MIGVEPCSCQGSGSPMEMTVFALSPPYGRWFYVREGKVEHCGVF